MNEKKKSSDPWYADGLQFTCTGCGDCCTGDPGVVWVTDDELQEIADYREQTIGEIRLFHTRLHGGRVSLTEFANGDCTFFDGATRRCQIYPVRPMQCRTWPFWKSNLESEAAWNQVCEDCPGAGTGELVTLEEIENRLSLDDD